MPVPVDHLIVVSVPPGSTEALSALVASLPAGFTAPLVIARHNNGSDHLGDLAEILAQASALPVHVVGDEIPLEAGVIYVASADSQIDLTDHRLLLSPPPALSAPSVDRLFRAAADVFGDRLIAIVLDGYGNDGVEGAQMVKQAGGTVIVQNYHRADSLAMTIALAPTVVDLAAAPSEMGQLLAELLREFDTPDTEDETLLAAILSDVDARTDFDFSRYKRPTIRRRLHRRLVATGQADLATYRAYLRRHPEEMEHLIDAFLIKVTTFFRDPEVFAYLRTSVMPELVARAREQGSELRLWSAGCATGEEAYSLALLVAELLGDDIGAISVRLFATDLDGDAIAYARRGIYPGSSLVNVPPELRERFFTETDGMCEVNKLVRGMIVFGEHDLGSRAPFPRIDLILCRNVLIYFARPLQERALRLFTFALHPGGYLVLGNSESPGGLAPFFSPVQGPAKIFRRRGDAAPMPVGDVPTRPLRPRMSYEPAAAARSLARVRQETQLARQAGSRTVELLHRLPVGVIEVDRHYDIQTINQQARRLFGIHGAVAGEDFLHALADPIGGTSISSLRSVIDAALRGEMPAPLEDLALEVRATGETRYVQVDVSPGLRGEERVRTVVIVVSDTTGAAVARQRSAAEHERVLRETQEELTRQQATVARLTAQVTTIRSANRELLVANEELSRENEELRAVNHEMVLGNEELVAASEEVETLNEELQASNEELETLNEELQATVEELHTSNDELQARTEELMRERAQGAKKDRDVQDS